MSDRGSSPQLETKDSPKPAIVVRSPRVPARAPTIELLPPTPEDKQDAYTLERIQQGIVYTDARLSAVVNKVMQGTMRLWDAVAVGKSTVLGH